MRKAAAERQGKVHTMMYTRQDVIVIAPVQGGREGGRERERER